VHACCNYRKSYARHNLGFYEKNLSQNMMHYMISARSGLKISMDSIHEAAKDGCITKDHHKSTLCAFQESTDAMKSDIREEAVSFSRPYNASALRAFQEFTDESRVA
jgi:hypothetical protein